MSESITETDNYDNALENYAVYSDASNSMDERMQGLGYATCSLGRVLRVSIGEYINLASFIEGGNRNTIPSLAASGMEKMQTGVQSLVDVTAREALTPVVDAIQAAYDQRIAE